MILVGDTYWPVVVATSTSQVLVIGIIVQDVLLNKSVAFVIAHFGERFVGTGKITIELGQGLSDSSFHFKTLLQKKTLIFND